MRLAWLNKRLIRFLRCLYRWFPASEPAKYRWVCRRAQSWPLDAILYAAQMQVLEEREEAMASLAREPAPAGASAPEPELPGAASAPLPRRPEAVRLRREAGGQAIGYVGLDEAAAPPMPAPARLVAFYLPQFHPIPENDAVWGRGFTEWANVARALPQVEGQVQPRLPGELGFYDLRVPEVMRRQVELARNHGLGGFCFHFYWFAGKRLLEAPLLRFLEDPECDLPFCLCWANENWTRRWDGYDSDVFVAQDHSPEDDLAFIEYIERYLRDPRYIRIDGKPVLVVYRPSLLPDPRKTARVWRDHCRRAGIGEILLVTTTSFDRNPPKSIGFDAALEFAPNNSNPTVITDAVRRINPAFSGHVYDWRCLVERSRTRSRLPYRLFPGVNPGWDNTPRKPDNGNIFLHASPRGYEEWLGNAIRHEMDTIGEPENRLVFINAWNEWAEGACLEPDSRLGYAYLAATRRALQQAAAGAAGTVRKAVELPAVVIVHAFYPELLDEMLAHLQAWSVPFELIVTAPPQREAQVRARLAAAGVNAECRVFANRGRDILPFLHVANELADAGDRLVVKLHSKRSLHRQDGDVWRRDLLAKLISPENAREIHAAFVDQPRLGMVAPEGHVLPMSFYWGSNEANVQYLCRRMGLPEVKVDDDLFVAGSMFWSRLSALRPLLDVHLEEGLFEQECGQVDGTMAHAIERALARAVLGAGMIVASTAAPRKSALPSEDDYGYAESSRGS